MHISFVTRQNLLQLGWEVFTHLLYSQDIPPIDNHLFQYLQNCVNEKTFQLLGRLQKTPEQLFAHKN